jgi:hypothetical protein
MPGTVHVHVLPAISTDGWRIEDVLENAEKVRGVYVTFQDALRPAGSAGALPPRERASARSGSRP